MGNAAIGQDVGDYRGRCIMSIQRGYWPTPSPSLHVLSSTYLLSHPEGNQRCRSAFPVPVCWHPVCFSKLSALRSAAQNFGDNERDSHEGKHEMTDDLVGTVKEFANVHGLQSPCRDKPILSQILFAGLLVQLD